MGIFDALFGRKRPSAGAVPNGELKLKLIRSFIKKRTIQDPMASAMGFSPDMVDELPLPMLMGMPEATLVTIVEAFATLKRTGLSDAKAFQQIESSRADSHAGDIPVGMTLEAYCGYRVSREHPEQDGQGEISDKHIFECVELSRTLYRC